MPWDNYLPLCIPTVRRFDLLKECVDSALSGIIIPTEIHILDNSAGKLPIELFEGEQYRIVSVYTAPENLGVAAGWNWLMYVTKTAPFTLIANDDVRFEPDTILNMVKVMAKNPAAGIFASSRNESNEFSCYALARWAYNLIGPFDEVFWPAYFEDNDYTIRARKAGVVLHLSDKFGFGHAGSATIKSYTEAEKQEHVRQFERNKAAYIAKWGGLPGKEVYERPYNTPKSTEIRYNSVAQTLERLENG
jgi:GT2 family glycosyltransferase